MPKNHFQSYLTIQYSLTIHIRRNRIVYNAFKSFNTSFIFSCARKFQQITIQNKNCWKILRSRARGIHSWYFRNINLQDFFNSGLGSSCINTTRAAFEKVDTMDTVLSWFKQSILLKYRLIDEQKFLWLNRRFIGFEILYQTLDIYIFLNFAFRRQYFSRKIL